MRQELRWAFEPGLLPFGGRYPQVFGVPEDHDRGEQIQPCDAEVLAFGGPVPDFALPPDAQGSLQSVMCFTFVQADIGAALHIGIEKPLDDEQRALDPTNLA